MPPEIVIVVLIVFAAALTRSTFGFGEALVAMPLLSMVVGVKVAAALVAMTSVFNALAILTTDRTTHIDWNSAWRLVVSCLLGIPVGVYGLMHVNEEPVKLVLAAVVIAFALYNLLRPQLGQFKSENPAFGFGFVSGILGGAYCAFGPPLVVFGTLRGWDPQRFRLTMQAVFLPASFFVVLNHYVQGVWQSGSQFIFFCFLVSLPGLFVAVLIGRWLNRRVPAHRFARYVSCLLLVIGAMLVATVLLGRSGESEGGAKAAAASRADTQTDRESADR